MTAGRTDPLAAGAMPLLVAHRGEAGRFPENTIVALEAAVAAGITHLEFDVQLSADRVPVLSHDATLVRTAGIDRLVTAALASELTTTSVGEAARFGRVYTGVCMPTLAEVLSALDAHTGLTLFVELKRHSLAVFGRRRVLRAVLAELRQCRHEIVLICFDEQVLRLAREQCGRAIGWVLSHYDEPARERAAALEPRYLFCNQARLPPDGRLWVGDWDWIIYEIESPAQALKLQQRGAHGLESMNAGELRRGLLAALDGA